MGTKETINASDEGTALRMYSCTQMANCVSKYGKKSCETLNHRCEKEIDTYETLKYALAGAGFAPNLQPSKAFSNVRAVSGEDF